MDHWNPRRSRGTSFSRTRRGGRHQRAHDERPHFRRDKDHFDPHEDEWLDEDDNEYRRSRSPLSDYDGNYRGRSGRGRPFRGRPDRGRSFRGRPDRGRPFRGRGRPFRGRGGRESPFRGSPGREKFYRESPERERFLRESPDRERFQRESPERERFHRGSPERERFQREIPERERFQRESPERERFHRESPDSGGNFRGRPYIRRPFRGRGDAGSFRGRPDRGSSFRGRPDRGSSFRGKPDRGSSFRGRDRGSSYRGRPDRGSSFRGSSDRERPFTGRLGRGGHFRESRESYQSSDDNSIRSRSISKERFYGSADKERYTEGEQFRSRSRSDSRERVYDTELIEKKKYMGATSSKRSNNQHRSLRSRSNSRDRLHPTESVDFVEHYERKSGFQLRKSRSPIDSRARFHPSESVGKERYFIGRTIKNEAEYKLRKARSRSDSREKLYAKEFTRSVRPDDDEYESKPMYHSKASTFEIEHVKDNQRIYQKRKSISPGHNYPSYKQSLQDKLYKEQTQSKTDMIRSSRPDFNQGSSHDRQVFDDDMVYESKPKVYRLSNNFGKDYSKSSPDFGIYSSSHSQANESDYQRKFPSSFAGNKSPPYPRTAYENFEHSESKRYPDERIKGYVGKYPSDKEDRITKRTGVDQFHSNLKRSYQNVFGEDFDKAGCSQYGTGQEEGYKKEFPGRKEDFPSYNTREVRPSFPNRTWIRKEVSETKLESSDDLGSLKHVTIFFNYNSSSINRNLASVVFNSFKRYGIKLNVIENCYEAEYRNMYYCILKWNAKELARAEDVDPIKAKQRAGLTLINKLAQTNYTIKSRPEYFCCPLETLREVCEPVGVCRFVKFDEARGVVKAFRLIDTQFETDKRVEIIFGGEDFKPAYLDGIKQYAEQKNYSYRFLAVDHLSVSYNHSPEFIKTDILENGTLSAKFELIPPLGPGNRLIEDLNLAGFLPIATKFFQGTHLSKEKKCANFMGKLKILEKRTKFEKATQLLEKQEDLEFARELINTLPMRKRKRMTRKLDSLGDKKIDPTDTQH